MTWTTRPRSNIAGLAAITAGSGPLVVLLHGVGLRSEAWNAQIDALTAAHHVLAFDMLGHGGSPLPGPTPQLSDYIQAVAHALPERAVVVGHSMGAVIALGLAQVCPEKLRGVVALNAIYRRGLAAAAAIDARANSLDGVTIADPQATLDRWFGGEHTPARAACQTWLTSVDPAGYRAAYRAFAAQDGPSDASLAKLPCPALFMTGAEEPNSTPAMSHAMAALAREGQSIIAQGAAHMMPMTHPKEVNAALAEFLSRCPA